jgi:excisionase family DNA binding protein
MTERRPRPRLQPAQHSTPTVFLTVSEAAALLRLSEITLGRWRIEGSGPPFRKFGRRVLYEHSDLIAWTELRKRVSTSEIVGNPSREAQS